MRTFLSPFRIFSNFDNDRINQDFDYKILKKKVLADFELNQDQPLFIDGVELNKTDALEVLESLKDPALRKAHHTIFQDEVLYQFLITRDFSLLNRYTTILNAEIKQIISPYFTDIYSEYLKTSIEKDKSITNLLKIDIQKFSIEEDQYQIYDSTYTFLNIFNQELLFILIAANTDLAVFHSKVVQINKEKLTNIFLGNINLLPNYFQDVRDSLTNHLLNISVELNNGLANYKLAFEYINKANNLKSVNIDKDLLKNNYKILKNNAQNNSPGNNWKAVLIGVIVIAKLIFLLSKCDSNTHKRNYHLPPYSYENIDIPPKAEKKKENEVTVEDALQNFINRIDSVNWSSRKWGSPENGTVLWEDPMHIVTHTEKVMMVNRSLQDAIFITRPLVLLNYESTATKAFFVKAKDSVAIDLDISKSLELKALVYLGADFSFDTCAVCGNNRFGISFKGVFKRNNRLANVKGDIFQDKKIVLEL